MPKSFKTKELTGMLSIQEELITQYRSSYIKCIVLKITFLEVNPLEFNWNDASCDRFKNHATIKHFFVVIFFPFLLVI